MLNTRTFRLAAAPLAIAAALALAACGGDDDNGAGDTDTAAEPIALAEWVTQADAICEGAEETLDERTQEFIDEAGEDPSSEDLENLANDVFTPTLQELTDELGELPPPDEDADVAEDFVDALQEGTDDLRDNPDLINSEEGPEAIQEATDLATDLGSESCGETVG